MSFLLFQPFSLRAFFIVGNTACSPPSAPPNFVSVSIITTLETESYNLDESVSDVKNTSLSVISNDLVDSFVYNSFVYQNYSVSNVATRDEACSPIPSFNYYYDSCRATKISPSTSLLFSEPTHSYFVVIAMTDVGYPGVVPMFNNEYSESVINSVFIDVRLIDVPISNVSGVVDDVISASAMGLFILVNDSSYNITNETSLIFPSPPSPPPLLPPLFPPPPLLPPFSPGKDSSSSSLGAVAGGVVGAAGAGAAYFFYKRRRRN